jgi:prepilin peptidase CpaA
MTVSARRQPTRIDMNTLFFIDLFTISLFLGLLALAVATDLESMRIPNRICLLIVALYPCHVLAQAAPVDWLGAMAVAGAVFLVGLIPFAFRLMGGGDVKLMAAVALWAGPALSIQFLAVTFFLARLSAIWSGGTTGDDVARHAV